MRLHWKRRFIFTSLVIRLIELPLSVVIPDHEVQPGHDHKVAKCVLLGDWSRTVRVSAGATMLSLVKALRGFAIHELK